MPTRKSKFLFVAFLTFVRVPLVFVFFVFALVHSWQPALWLFWVAFLSLLLSALTDLLDGYFARKFDVSTPVGAYADPLSDKVVYLVSLPLLIFLTARNGDVQHALVLLVFTVLFLLRDQWVSFLRSIGSLYGVSGKANWSGKLRTVINFPLICIIYFNQDYGWLPMSVMYVLEGSGLLINLISMYVYGRNYWPSLVKAADISRKQETPPMENPDREGIGVGSKLGQQED
jgi:CDP-diacylglycerol---glycerol-3-phosphate 3-phosphatidyltransferase